MGTCHYMFVQAYSLYLTKSEPACRLWILNDEDMLMQAYRLQQMAHPGGGY